MAHGTKWDEQGEEPDYRFSLANERTFLAWVRTALAILAGAILLHEFASHIRPASFIGSASIALALLAAILGAGAYLHWKANEIAMRHARPLPYSRLLPGLAICILALSAAAGMVLLRQ
jgi:putative membrane protein